MRPERRSVAKVWQKDVGQRLSLPAYGSDAEMATLAGDATSGFTASLTIGVSV